MVSASSFSPSIGTANSMVMKGCKSWTWLTRTVPPSTSPRYQAKKPSHMENTPKYTSAHQALAGTAWAGHNSQVAGRLSGRASNSAQLITCSGRMV